MINEVLTGLYADSPRLFQLADRLTMSGQQKIKLLNLHGSAAAFVFSSIFEHSLTSKLNHVLICEDAESAAYFHNTIENLTKALDIFYFPSSFKNKKNYRLLNSSHVVLRTEALTKIASAQGNINKKVFISYPEALFEKVIVPGKLSSNIIYIKSGDVLNTEQLLLKLSD